MTKREVKSRYGNNALLLSELTDERYLYSTIDGLITIDVLRSAKDKAGFKSRDMLKNIMTRFESHPYVVKIYCKNTIAMCVNEPKYETVLSSTI